MIHTQSVPPSSSFVRALGDFRWVRAHVSAFAVGAVLMVIANLLIGGDRLWSLTVIGIWSMLIVVHLVVLAIARLSGELLADDDEEIVLLPVKDAVIVEPASDPTGTWSEAPTPTTDTAKVTDPPTGDPVSWQSAVDAAQAKHRDSPKQDSVT